MPLMHSRRRGAQVADEEAVDPHRARAHPLADALGPRRVLGVDDPSQPVARAIGERHGLVFVREGLEGQHRAEHLVLHDLGLVAAGLDQGRLVPEPALLGDVPADQHPVSRRPRPLDEAFDTREVLGMDERRERGAGLLAVARDVLAV